MKAIWNRIHKAQARTATPPHDKRTVFDAHGAELDAIGQSVGIRRMMTQLTRDNAYRANILQAMQGQISTMLSTQEWLTSKVDAIAVAAGLTRNNDDDFLGQEEEREDDLLVRCLHKIAKWRGV